MRKRARQYLGLLAAIFTYYAVHEGAHLLYAVFIGAFRRIRFLGFGVQIDVYQEGMTDLQMGIFCLLGAAATALAAWVLTAAASRLAAVPSQELRACLYYITAAMLILDPLYLSLLCGFVGGGDMNGIGLLLSQTTARLFFGALLVFHVLLFCKIVLPAYKKSFEP